MGKHEIFTELEDIHSKYERLTSLIGIMQMYVAEVVEIAGAPSCDLANALFEVEMEMDKTNDKLKGYFSRKAVQDERNHGNETDFIGN